MAILLSLCAAVTYGAADFVGGLMTKRNDVFRVVFISQLFGLLPLVVAFVVLNDGSYSTRAIGWGIAAGIAGATGVLLLYRGLAIGRMSVVAPITAVEAAVVPVLFGLITGERPSSWALAGVVIALASVALISSVPDEDGLDGRARRSGLAEALGAGLAFGAFFILLDGAGDDAGMWPLVAMRLASLVLVALILVGTRPSLRPAKGTLVGIAFAGMFDVVANVFYLLSTRRGLLAIVAVITSMYPAMTVLLARLWLKESFAGIQRLGLVLAGAAITLIAIG